MADGEKTKHISKLILERFSVRSLSEAELTEVARHLSACPACQASFVSTLRHQRGDAGLSFTLAPEFWLRHEHLDYEDLVKLSDNKLASIDREFINDHLKLCPPCQEDIRSFLAFRQQIAQEMRVSYARVEPAPVQERPSSVSWWRRLVWKPVYSAGVVVVGIVLLIGAVFLFTRRTDNQQAQKAPTPQVSPASAPSLATNLPSPTVLPNESPTEKPTPAEAIVLNDEGRTVTVDKSGNVAGLDDVPATTRNEIAQVLLSGRIGRPPILKELGGEPSALRGSNRGQPFTLIEPARTVIMSNRPTFKWDGLPGATAYTVYVTEASGQIVATSDTLVPDHREWLVSKPLTRGQVYAWTVVGIVNGEEIVSPGANASEMRFQVLSMSNWRQLNQLKKSASHLALGIFCAKIGLVPEAQRELQAVVRANPTSRLARKLLEDVSSLTR